MYQLFRMKKYALILIKNQKSSEIIEYADSKIEAFEKIKKYSKMGTILRCYPVEKIKINIKE